MNLLTYSLIPHLWVQRFLVLLVLSTKSKLVFIFYGLNEVAFVKYNTIHKQNAASQQEPPEQPIN